MTANTDSPRTRILAIHRYFWPDTPPYASLLRVIGRRWANDGHEVEILSTQPSYKPGVAVRRQPALENVDGMRVRRIRLPGERGKAVLRILNTALMGAAIVEHAVRRGPFDVIVASTAPPVVIGAAACVAAKLTGAQFVYHCMDIHPEIGRLSGEFANPVVFRILQKIDMWTCRQAARVVVLSSDMAASVDARTNAANRARVEIVNNFALPDLSGPSASTEPDSPLEDRGRFRIVFAGNIGRFQGLETAVDAMRLLESRSDIELVVVGEGKAAVALRERAGRLVGDTIHFVPHQPVAVARRIMANAHLGLVSLARDIYRYAYPSKVMTYLAEGCPVLALVEPESELAEFVRSTGVGLAAAPGDPEALAAAISAIANQPEQVAAMRVEAKRVALARFSEEAVLPRWSRLIQTLDSGDVR